jgi:hypothetical protein
MEFKIDERPEQPFKLRLDHPFRTLPAGALGAGAIMAEVGWPDNLGRRRLNNTQFELSAPPFGRVLLTIRGTLVEADDEPQATRR